MARQYNFEPSKRQLNYKFEQWGRNKYGKRLRSTESEPSHSPYRTSVPDPFAADSALPWPFEPFTDYSMSSPAGETVLPQDEADCDTPWKFWSQLDMSQGDNLDQTATSDEHATFLEALATNEHLKCRKTLLLPDQAAWDHALVDFSTREKLAADFCLAVSDNELAFTLYAKLCESQLFGPYRLNDITAEVLMASCARSVDQHASAQVARSLVCRYKCTQPDGRRRPFLLSMLDATIQEKDNLVDRDTASTRIADIMSGVLGSGISLTDLPHSYQSIDLVTYHFLSLGLECYYSDSVASGVDASTCAIPTDRFLNQYLAKQPVFDLIGPEKHPRRTWTMSSVSSDGSNTSTGSYSSYGGDVGFTFSASPSPCFSDLVMPAARSQRTILRKCLCWCREILHDNVQIPAHMYLLANKSEHSSCADNIQLFCALWDAMISSLRRGDPKPVWYAASEEELGIPATELLMTVSWILGDLEQASSDRKTSTCGAAWTVLCRASQAVDTVAAWSERHLWDSFLCKFTMMNRPGTLAPGESYKNDVVGLLRDYVSMALDLPLPSFLSTTTDPCGVSNVAVDAMPSSSHQLPGSVFSYATLPSIPVASDGDFTGIGSPTSVGASQNMGAVGSISDYPDLPSQEWPPPWSHIGGL